MSATNRPYRHQIDAVRLGEFDMGGVLYHANYFHLYEEAREALLRSGGVSYPSLVERKLHLAIVESHQSFLRPVRFGMPLIVSLGARAIRRATLEIHYNIFEHQNKGETLLHRAWTKHVLVDVSGTEFTVAAFPEELKQLFARHEILGDDVRI